MVLKIADLNLSRWFENENLNLTKLVGTPRTMAPELFKKENYGHPVDIYACGKKKKKKKQKTPLF